MHRLPAWVEVDLDAMKWNIERIRSRIAPGVRILLVVKADAYGHGAVRIARFAEECGIHMLGVATLDEGRELRRAGIALPILILSPVLTGEIDEVLENDLAVAASTLDFAEAAARAARRRGKRCSVHVEIDTGMGRAGFSEEHAVETITKASLLEGLSLDGIFTHFPASDVDSDFTRDQIAGFTAIVDELARSGVTFPYVHCANSAAVLNFPASHFNLVRPGLLVYGHASSVSLRDKLDVVPVMSFKTRLILVREMPAGSSISYGRTFVAEESFLMGIIPVGYGHGMSHRLSNTGKVLLRGVRVPITGRVTMDMTMIDVSAFPDAAVGEEVVLFGSQGAGEITVDEIAQWEGTLNYEIICRISKRVVRVYLRSGKVDSLKTLLGVQEAL